MKTIKLALFLISALVISGIAGVEVVKPKEGTIIHKTFDAQGNTQAEARANAEKYAALVLGKADYTVTGATFSPAGKKWFCRVTCAIKTK